MFIDYYKVLGISKNAKASEIKEAYRQMAKTYHPDRNPEPEAHEQFLLINKAYKILSDKDERELYNYAHYANERKVEKPKSKSSIEITREKRQTRYKRGYYSRPSFSRPVRQKSYAREESESAKRRASYEAGKSIGFFWLAQIFKIMAGLSVLLCLFLTVDYWFQEEVESNSIVYKNKMAYSFFSPGVYSIQTEEHRFRIHKSYASRIFEGMPIPLKVTPMGKTVTKIGVPSSRLGRIWVNPWGGVYGGTFLVIIILLISSSLTLVPSLNNELVGYMGLFNLLFQIILLRTLF